MPPLLHLIFRGLAQLSYGEKVIVNPVGSHFGVGDLNEDNPIDAHLDIVFSDANLFGYVNGLFLQSVFIGNSVHKDKSLLCCFAFL